MSSWACAEEITLQIAAIGPTEATPYKSQLHVQVINESFTSIPLLEKMSASELIVDGHSFKRTDVPFEGPPGLPAKGSWEGCMGWDAYALEGIKPGFHHLKWHVGNTLSQEIRIKWPKPAPAADSPKERLHQVQALKEAMTPGLLRSCVENWFPDKDGGLASSGTMRYYVDPGVKVLVPYDKSIPEPRVNGPIKMYLESRVAD